MQLERHQKILELMDIKGNLRVSELSRYFGVTYETIRRDFDIMEKRGQLKKTMEERHVFAKPEVMKLITTGKLKEKQEIAAEAVKLIMPGDSIMLDGRRRCCI